MLGRVREYGGPGGKKGWQDEKGLGLRRLARETLPVAGPSHGLRTRDIWNLVVGYLLCWAVLGHSSHPSSWNLPITAISVGEWGFRTPGKKMKFYVGSTKGWKDRAARGKLSETDYLLETGNSLLRIKSLNMPSAHQHSLCVGYCCLLAWDADGWPRSNQS